MSNSLEEKNLKAEHSNDEAIEMIVKESQKCPECIDYLSGWKRAKADYENLKKDSEKARAEYARYANEQCLIQLLPAFDQFEVAMRYMPPLSSIPEQDRKAFDTWVTGLEAVNQLWNEGVKEMGLEPVRDAGAFDPTLHEAAGSEKSDNVPPGDIVRLVQNGYALNGKLIRPAKVIVAE